MTGIKVDNRVNFECLVEVKKHLTPGNFERMLSEYQLIDFLYKIADFPLQTQTMKWLMKSGEVVSNRTPSKRYMKFNLGGHDYKFGHVEFALISGLNFEHIPSVDESVMTPLREFLGQSTLFVQLGAKLDEASAKDKDSELTRKLVVLVIVHSLIFPKTDFKVVHVKSICLVDEPDLFNLYPWGRMIYDEIIKEWWIFFARISKEKAKGTKMTFRLVTFPIMIQCWVLECLTPELSCLLGERVPGKIYPRILRWTRTDFGDIKLAEQTIFHADEVFFIRMTPEEDELEKVYYKNVLAYLGYDPEPVKTVPLKRRRMQPTEDDGDDDVPGFLSISLNLKKLASKMDKGLQQLGNRLGALEEKVSKLEMEMPTEIERKSVKRMKNTIAYDLKVAKYEMMKEVRAELNLKPPSPIRPFEVCEVDYEDDGAEKSIEDPAIVVVEEPALNNRGRPRRERKAANVIEETKLSYQGRPHREKKPVIKSPYTDLEKKYKRRKMKDAVKIDTKDWVDDPLPTPYNPPEDYAYNTTKWDILKSWIDGNLYRENIVGLEAVVDTVAAISCKVLKNLVSEKGWLSNEDIDAMLRLLNMQQDTFPRTFTSTRWTCLGSVYNRLIRPAYESFSKNRLLVAAEGAAQMDVPWELINMDLCQVVAGMNMSWFSKPWKNCDYVYGIQNIANMHWVAYEYDFKEKEVKVYDSLRSDIPTDIFGLHAAIIPSLYNLEVENKEDKMDPDIPFNVKYVDVPRQPNTHDCGVYSCKFVQCLAMQKSCGDLKAEHFIDFRRKFGVDLVKWAKDTNGNHVFYETDILV